MTEAQPSHPLLHNTRHTNQTRKGINKTREVYVLQNAEQGYLLLRSICKHDSKEHEPHATELSRAVSYTATYVAGRVDEGTCTRIRGGEVLDLQHKQASNDCYW